MHLHLIHGVLFINNSPHDSCVREFIIFDYDFKHLKKIKFLIHFSG